MSLYNQLQLASSEEDVKDAYIKALNLKGYQKNLIDIQTKEIWFEAKDSHRTSTYAMFTQLLHYVQFALGKGEEIPPFLAVIDTQKAAIMRTEDVLPLLKQKTINWGKSASSYTPDALDKVSAFIGSRFVSFRIETHEKEFIETVKSAIKSGTILRTQITPDNLKQVFDKWVKMIGREINGVTEDQYALLFYADIMHDGTVATHENLPAELLHKNNAPVFSLGGHIYELSNKEGYRQFWSIYHRPPEHEFRDYLLERRDSLIPVDERKFKGAYFTPLHIVDRAYDKLSEILGKNWQKEYLVWDMCCGVGNLEVKHSNPRNLYMSTLDPSDIDVMRATRTCVAANRFQYDYLNDDIADDGYINYDLTNKVPHSLREAIAAGKKILVLINPPYAEAGSSIGKEAKNKVASTRVAQLAMSSYGKASNELFTQFLARIAVEIPNATIAMFSKMKYVNASNFESFRESWIARYLGGFVVHSKAFDGLKGNFPIGFLIWQTAMKKGREFRIDVVPTEVLTKDGTPIGEKNFYNLPADSFLNSWLVRPKPNGTQVIPLKNAVSPYTSPKYLDKWSDGAIGYMWCQNNDLQHSSQQTALFSSVWGDGHGFYVNESNLLQSSVIYTVRRIVKPTWLNDRDQFLQPSVELPDEFVNDCLVWMLFSGSNLTAGSNNLEWNGEHWNLVNHFIPFSEDEVNSSERFESDFMVQFLANRNFSDESTKVLSSGRELWKQFFSKIDTRAIRDQYKINRSDAGWYQVRKALQSRNLDGDSIPVSFDGFDTSFKALGEKLLPKVFEYGFLKP